MHRLRCRTLQHVADEQETPPSTPPPASRMLDTEDMSSSSAGLEGGVAEGVGGGVLVHELDDEGAASADDQEAIELLPDAGELGTD